MRKLFRRLRYWIRLRQIEADLAEEIEIHRAMKQEKLEQSGLPATDAQYASRRTLGNSTLAGEDARGIWIWPWLESVWQDPAHVVRSLRRQPGFTLVAFGTLSSAIGLNTSLFTAFKAVFCQPWPVKDPAQVAQIVTVCVGCIGSEFSLTEYRYLEDDARAFADLLATGCGADARIESCTSRLDVAGALKTTSDRVAYPGSRISLRGLLLAAQVAISIVLLVAAALLVRGIHHGRNAL